MYSTALIGQETTNQLMATHGLVVSDETHYTGEPQTFTLSVKPARNYPLDMYFLMDLSGSMAPDLDSLRNLSGSIGEYIFSMIDMKLLIDHTLILPPS